jgi:enoyl-CoA hydratase
MSDSSYVHIDREGDLAIVTIDRQERLNALNAQVLSELSRAFDSLRDDDRVRGVVLSGAGEKAFVAGADVAELATLDAVSGVSTSRRGQEVFNRIERFPKPVLAAVGGYALGGGCELALSCHLRVASDNARFGLPEVTLGIMPGYGGTVRLARLIGLGRALELTLTGEPITAERAAAIGLVSAVYPQSELLEGGKGLLRRITRNAPLAVRMALESVYGALSGTTEQGLDHESSLFGLLASTADMKEGLAAFLEKRKPTYRGL